MGNEALLFCSKLTGRPSNFQPTTQLINVKEEFPFEKSCMVCICVMDPRMKNALERAYVTEGYGEEDR